MTKDGSKNAICHEIHSSRLTGTNGMQTLPPTFPLTCSPPNSYTYSYLRERLLYIPKLPMESFNINVMRDVWAGNGLGALVCILMVIEIMTAGKIALCASLRRLTPVTAICKHSPPINLPILLTFTIQCSGLGLHCPGSHSLLFHSSHAIVIIYLIFLIRLQTP